jgi:predicted ATPase/class 3 adenylate cyclase
MDQIASFGEWLRRARKACDLTQAELAQRVGCAEGTIRNLEADALRPSKQLAARLAAQLGLDTSRQAEIVAFARGGAAPIPDPPAPPELPERAAPPSGVVTFLFTDIEGSTARWEHDQQAARRALARHNAILSQAIAARQGYLFKTIGDAACAAFARPADAIAAALDAQRALRAEEWGAPGPLRVRMALHTGAADIHAGDYHGLPLSRVARLLAAGHGGQILLSRATAELAREGLPAPVALRDRGTHRLKGLSLPEQIFQLVAPDLPADFPPLRTLEASLPNLPAQPTPLIGRAREVAAVRELLLSASSRLVTLSGPGGVGKTRLALQAATELAEAFADGVCFVALASIGDPALVALSIAQALGIKETDAQSPAERIAEHLRRKQILLVLDNFEQVIDAAPLLADLLAAAPQLRLLVTSRAVLRVSGERELAVPPLALPERGHLPPLEELSQYEAIALFTQRAQAVSPGFQLTAGTAPAVAQICAQLDGLPLAIELAAARTKLLAPHALLARLHSRLALLTGGQRDLPARQQTLRSAIDWSYELLDAGMRALFMRLGVFAGSFSLAAAEAIASELSTENRGLRNSSEHSILHPSFSMLHLIEALVDQSLLRQAPGSDEEPRFALLETIREYALERLESSGEAEQLRRRHALYYLALAEAAEPELLGAEQSAWLPRLDVEHDNLQAALAWCQTDAGDVELGLRLCDALWCYWEIRGLLQEGRRWLEGMLALAPGRTALRAAALTGAGGLAFNQGDYAAACALHDESLQIRRELGDRRGIAVSLGNLGNVALEQGDLGAARARYEDGLAIMRELDDTWLIATVLHNLGNVAREQGDYAVARARYEESLAIMRGVGDKRSLARSLHDLGHLALEQDDDRRATALLEESLALFREMADRQDSAFALYYLGLVACRRQDYTAARALYQESLQIRRELGDRRGIAQSLAGLAGVARALGRIERSARLLGAAEAILEAMGGCLDTLDRAIYERTVGLVRAELDAAALAASWAEGRRMPLEQIVGYALGEGNTDD